MSIEYPADAVMLMLVAHAAGDRFTVTDGELHITVRSEGRTVPAPTGALDDLESRGWLVVEPDGRTALTERGEYWVRRWLTGRLGKGRVVTGLRFRVTGEVAD